MRIVYVAMQHYYLLIGAEISAAIRRHTMPATQAFRDTAPNGFFASLAAAYAFVVAVIADARALRARFGGRYGEDC